MSARPISIRKADSDVSTSLAPTPSTSDLLCVKTTESSHDATCSFDAGDSYANLASTTLGGPGGHTTFEAMLGWEKRRARVAERICWCVRCKLDGTSIVQE